VRHGDLFRVVVVSADGKKYASTVQVDTHRRVPSKRVFNDLADRWRLPRPSIDDVLAHWSAERLIKHLSSLPYEELMSREPIYDASRPVRQD